MGSRSSSRDRHRRRRSRSPRRHHHSRRSRRSRSRSRSPSPHHRRRHDKGASRRGDDSPRAGEAARASKQQEEAERARQDAARRALVQEQSAGRAGGVYVAPFRLRQMMMQEAESDKSSAKYQKLTWENLRKRINGIVNKINAGNMQSIVVDLFHQNIVRGRGLLCRALQKAQLSAPKYTPVYACAIAIVNTKMPETGELLLKRLVHQFRRAYKRNDKHVCVGLATFLAHLVNYQVAHEILALQLLTILLEKPTDDSVEIAVEFTKECGAMLNEITPQGLHAIFERFRAILHEGALDVRTQYVIEAGFAEYVAVKPELDLVESEDQITHEVSFDDDIDVEQNLDYFREDADFEANEAAYAELRKDILGGDEGSDEEGSGSGSGSGESDSDDDDDDEDDDEDGNAASTSAGQPLKTQVIQDATGTNIVNLRKTIYLTIMSSASFEECVHKLLRLQVPVQLQDEMCKMVIECCSQERTYIRFYGLLGERLCSVHKSYQECFGALFQEHYGMIHRFETNKLRNIAKLFAHLLHSDAIPWTVFSCIRMTEQDTTASSRIFVKIVFQELAEFLGIPKLRERLADPFMQESFAGLFPKDHPRNARFSINFFTAIGLGAITEEMREWLKNAPRMIPTEVDLSSESDSESSSASSSSYSSSASSSSRSYSGSSSSPSRSPSRSASRSPRRGRRRAASRSRSRSRSQDRAKRSRRS